MLLLAASATGAVRPPMAVGHTAPRALVFASSKRPEVKGSYYRRPAKAVEKGGGFYVPGLEGDRLRLSVATLVLGALSLNHIGSAEPIAESQQISESIGVGLALWTLGQIIVERTGAARSSAPAVESDTSAAGAQQRSALAVDDITDDLEAATAAEFFWASRVGLESTRARAVFLAKKSGEVVARCSTSPELGRVHLGDSAAQALSETVSTKSEAEKVLEAGRALQACLATGGGQVPAAALCAQAGDQLCLVALSDRPDAFEAEDAQWLATLAARIGAVA